MIHFHHQTTFQVLPSIAILTHSETKRFLSKTQLVDEEHILAGTIP